MEADPVQAKETAQAIVDPFPQLGIECENCHSVNRASSRICRACGADLEAVREELPRLQEHQTRRAASAARQAAEAERQRASEEARRSWRQLRWDLLIAVVSACIIGLLVVAAGLVYRAHVRQQREGAAAQLAQAQAELDAQDYGLARDRLLELLSREPGYPGAQVALRKARLGLARQMFAKSQWLPATVELVEALRETPGDQEAEELLAQVLDEWCRLERSEGGWLRRRLAKWVCAGRGMGIGE